jgi:putative two-component system response regulator
VRVLIADDNEVALAVIGRALAGAGHEVVAARDGEEALAIVRSGACRLVVSDWEMPRMTGPELCRAIRSEDLHGYVYVILLTVHDSTAERVEGLGAGADDFVAKPFDADELVARVHTGERILSLETRDVATFALAKLVESRDHETGEHLERVRGHARVLADHLAGVPELCPEADAEYIRLIHQTSPLHDIGKVGIPDRVLLKPGKLTPAEFEIMKTHTTLGASTLDAAVEMFPNVGFLRMARDIALTHHERYDGTGYPRGLKGDAIPLCGRIVALADVYDALTSKRMYKDAFPHAMARSIIVGESGEHFDPRVVGAFVATEARFVSIRERFSERLAAAA